MCLQTGCAVAKRGLTKMWGVELERLPPISDAEREQLLRRYLIEKLRSEIYRARRDLWSAEIRGDSRKVEFIRSFIEGAEGELRQHEGLAPEPLGPR